MTGGYQADSIAGHILSTKKAEVFNEIRFVCQSVASVPSVPLVP